MSRWTLAALFVAVAFFVIAVSRSVYEATSPEWLSWHIALRKSYSIVAFALVGYTFLRAIERWVGRRSVTRSAIVIGYVAAYSALIEIGQYLNGSTEGLLWNAFDATCGGAGGALALIADSLLARARGVR